MNKLVNYEVKQSNSEHKRGRPRSNKVSERILKATIELLFEEGLRKTTVDEISARAEVSKATIYKWWPNKNVVSIDAFLFKMEAEVKIPDTGSVREDFLQQLLSVMRFYKSPIGKVFTQLIAESQYDPHIATIFRERFLVSRQNAVQVMLQRGFDRNEIRNDIDSKIIIDLIYGPMIYRLLTGHAPLDDNLAKSIVDVVIKGIRV
ncbi:MULTISPECIES: TetR/AcrR family transcriptional regulator [Bacillus cereus group]|uniref:TetR/AcrR family transcriptional regulator n=1 Tax=Bacillus TaxID=1386 RepID=UPI001F2FCDA2|nr:TetR/AcrR family transcriptional regulator [Bacillus mycoides]MCQ6358853.1 TetR/AcrR family transcriptional regulator [Bacillus cereus]